jgi:uncharacterized protein involved in exopolysaccharide biosynthesis
MDVADLVRTLWAGRWIIIITVAVFTILSIIYSLSAKTQYRADVVLVPASDEPMPSAMGALGGLASLAGINIGGGGSKAVEALAMLKSKAFAREFIETQKLQQVLLAERGGSGMLGSLFSSSGDADPRLALEMFDRGVRSVSEDRKTGLITLSIQWKDANVAANWANAVVRQLNERMRLRALSDSERNVQYLQKELASTNVVSLQQAIGRLLESEMQKIMMARGNEEFAFKVIDAATPPRRQVWPRPVLLAALAMLVGGIFSGVFVLLRGRP